MKAGNTATLKQLNDAVTKNGFTMKDSTAIIAGTVTITGGTAMLRVSGSNDLLQLVPQSGATPKLIVGKAVVIEGTIPEGVKGKSPDSIRYQSMADEKSE